MTIEVLEVKQEGMPLDLVLWRRFGVELRGRVESTLEANRDLARLGPILPVGLKIEVELPKAGPAPAPVKVLRLWE